jgi:5-methyltetrahydropteroyltriglutamate--homocysteine methyltransferase
VGVIRSASHSSYPRIGDAAWDQQLRRAARERDRGFATEADFASVEDEVAALVVADQARAFVDVVTDGLVRWSGPYSHLTTGWDGVELDGLVRWFETGLYDRRPRVTGTVSRRASVTVRDAKLAFEVRPKDVKAVLPGPVTLAHVTRLGPADDRAALADAFSAALSAEAAELAAAGVRILQVDEPILCRRPEDAPLVARCVGPIFEAAGPGATTILSTYFGDLAAPGLDLQALPGTHLGLDMVHGPGNWPLLTRLPEGRGLHLGLFDARTVQAESSQEVFDRIVPYREILMARDVFVGPQCGLELIPRDVAFEKLLQARYVKERLEREWRWRS